MKKDILYIIATVLPVFAACEKEEPGTGTPSKGTDDLITISTGLDTRSIPEKEITLYCYAGNTALIDGKTATQNNSVWSIEATGGNNGKYEWQQDVDHRFFCWTQKDMSDNTPSAFFGTGFTYANNVLTIPAKTLAAPDSHMDFCYSDVVKRTVAKADYSTVELTLKHLFTAFAFSAENLTAKDVVIKNVKLYGIHNAKSATVTFGDASVSAVYTDTNPVTKMSAVELISESAGITLASEEKQANIALGASDETKYFLMWPQTTADLTCSATRPTDTAPASGAYVAITYSMDGGEDITMYSPFPQDENDDAKLGWPAGTRRDICISFTEKSLFLTFAASPWNQTEPAFDYSGAATVSAGLHFFNESYMADDINNKIFFKEGNPIILEFKINSPVGSSWMVEKVGDFDAFEVDNVTPGTGTGIVGDGIDTKEGLIDGNEARIAIYPKSKNPKRDYSITLSFTVRNNSGTVTPVNAEMYAATGNQDAAWNPIVILK